MKRFILLGAVLTFGACAGDETDKGSEDTATGDTETDLTTGCPTVYSGPVLIQSATVTCDASDVVTYDVVTDGWTLEGIINAMETANATPWNDEHDLSSYEYDDCGFEDNLNSVLGTGAATATNESNANTVFTCDNHFADANGVMTYSARVYDLDGAFADCLAWGNDPEGWRDGVYEDVWVNPPVNPAEFSSCLVARRAK